MQKLIVCVVDTVKHALQAMLGARKQLTTHQKAWDKHNAAGARKDAAWRHCQPRPHGERHAQQLDRRQHTWEAKNHAITSQLGPAQETYTLACQAWLHFIDQHASQLPNSYCGLTLQVEGRSGLDQPVLRLQVGYRFIEGMGRALKTLNEVHMPACVFEHVPPINSSLPTL